MKIFYLSMMIGISVITLFLREVSPLTKDIRLIAFIMFGVFYLEEVIRENK